MTNFRLFQTERVCRRQFQIWRKWQKAIQMGRKHCGKRRNCPLRAISPFPSVFKRLVSQGRQKVSLCGNGLNIYHTILTQWKRPFENIVGKGENAGNQHFHLFPPCFLTIPKHISFFQLHLIFCLQMLSIWTSPQFCRLVKLTFNKATKFWTGLNWDNLQTTNITKI